MRRRGRRRAHAPQLHYGALCVRLINLVFGGLGCRRAPLSMGHVSFPYVDRERVDTLVRRSKNCVHESVCRCLWCVAVRRECARRVACRGPTLRPLPRACVEPRAVHGVHHVASAQLRCQHPLVRGATAAMAAAATDVASLGTADVRAAKEGDGEAHGSTPEVGKSGHHGPMPSGLSRTSLPQPASGLRAAVSGVSA